MYRQLAASSFGGTPIVLSKVDPDICVCSPWIECYCGGTRDAWDEIGLTDVLANRKPEKPEKPYTTDS